MSAKWLESINTFTESVKKGVLSADMAIIVEALEEFTGEQLTEVQEEVEEPVAQEDETPPLKSDDFTMPTGTTNTNKRHTARKETLDLSDRQNVFEDDGSIETEDAKGLINDQSVKPVTRRRPAGQSSVPVKCSVCNKEESVHPSHVREFYRCAACCRG